MEKRDPYFLARLSTLFEIQQKGLIFTLQRKLKQKVEFLSDFQTLCKLVNSDTDYCNFLQLTPKCVWSHCNFHYYFPINWKRFFSNEDNSCTSQQLVIAPSLLPHKKLLMLKSCLECQRLLFLKRLFKNVSRVEEVKSALLFSSCVVVIVLMVFSTSILWWFFQWQRKEFSPLFCCLRETVKITKHGKSARQPIFYV